MKPRTANSKISRTRVASKDPGRPIERQIVLLAHAVRLDEQDPLKRIAIDETGGRIRSDFRRAGRPRTKLYDTTRSHAIRELIKEGYLPRDVIAISIQQKLNYFIVEMAQDRHI